MLVFNLDEITGRTRQHFWAMRKLANLFLWQEWGLNTVTMATLASCRWVDGCAVQIYSTFL